MSDFILYRYFILKDLSPIICNYLMEIKRKGHWISILENRLESKQIRIPHPAREKTCQTQCKWTNTIRKWLPDNTKYPGLFRFCLLVNIMKWWRANRLITNIFYCCVSVIVTWKLCVIMNVKLMDEKEK